MAADERLKGLYDPVPRTDLRAEDEDVEDLRPPPSNGSSNTTARHWRFLTAHLMLCSLWIFFIFSHLPISWMAGTPDRTAPWSPLKDLLEYEPQVFHTGFPSDLTKYQGAPNEQNGKAWEELTEVGIVLLDGEQASKLPNKTVEWPKTPGKYLAAVSVFHQLHCVDYLRKTMFAASIGNATLDRKTVTHLDHCSDYLRQVLMCHADITITSFRWNEDADIYQPVFNGLQQCRKFESIFEWAQAHRAPGLRP